ncbi:2-C-methyl-D-erythritol 4-phosphate cytidylyltransferase [Janthinobacterium sp. B9-8]|uniref:2-C-methyl-D-erythritol 4-phosphate cytidylyltransferase n=1 Tax=Janthinobacterium sp. B9-8 TaxID=1236179 RepID=UPI00061D3B11|nr:2-C-methyl-D-erythritol 4-phosphate cytidylyltransferase [Janthinobacterium sp. B9-8]AMC35729.1 2-C-methyl-D-erythritol 4-phosphate cytidylyltransferase [Janthinobacterium sp. B9-8]
MPVAADGKKRMIALIPAAGSGSRMVSATPKQYLDLAGKPLIWHTLCALAKVSELDRIVVVISPEDEWWESFDWREFKRLEVLRCGGASRAESVLNGLRALQGPDDWVLVHDAARPCLDPALVSQMIAELANHPVGGILAVPVADTLKLAQAGQHIAHTHPRDGLWQAQTPQMFRVAQLAHALAIGMGPDITDEASALEKLGLQPKLIMGSPWNLKVTYPQDLRLAELILAAGC